MGRRVVGLLIGAIALGATAGAPAAVADGLPVPGVTTPGGGVPGPYGTHYVTDTNDGHTVVSQLGKRGTLRSVTVSGSFTVPAVALDGSPSGLAADGSTLVLIEPRRSFPQTETRLLILDARDLSIRRPLTLDGDFSFDAISPDGSELYLIEYTSPRDSTRYAVRRYDLQSGGMLSEPIVDPDESAGEMRGYPMTRTTSSDGRWAYTLYDGGGKEPFVHALDTLDGRAVCVDLDGLVKPSDVGRISMELGSDGGKLVLAKPEGPVAAIDTHTLVASGPGGPAPTTMGGGSGVPWMLLATTGVAVLLGAGAFVMARHRRSDRLATRDV